MSSTRSYAAAAPRALVSLTALSALLMTACASPAQPAGGDARPPAVVDPKDATPGEAEEGADTPSASGTGMATLVLPAESITFDLAFCSVDAADILIHGPAAGTGEPSYLNAGFVTYEGEHSGDARVDLGATGQFQSTDDIYVFSTSYNPGQWRLDVDGEGFRLNGSFHNGHGETLGQGTLTVDCG